MRIRRHLFFYNTVSVLVALVAMLAVNGMAAHAIGRYYQRQAEEMFQELWDGDSFEEGAIWLDRGKGDLEVIGGAPQPRSKFFGRPRRRPGGGSHPQDRRQERGPGV